MINKQNLKQFGYSTTPFLKTLKPFEYILIVIKIHFL